MGLSDAVSTLLDYLPDSLKDARIVRVFTPPYTQKVAQQIQAWRHPTNPIDVHSFTHLHPPAHNTELVLTMPRAEDAPRIAARLLATTIPFAILLPSDLSPRIPDAGQFPDHPNLRDAYKKAGKIMFLDSDHLWFLGNLPSLDDFAKIFSSVLDRPSPLLSHYAGTLPTPVPTTLGAWKQAQQLESDFLTRLDPDSLADCNGLTVFRSADFPSRILVPPSLRDALITQHYHDLQHVSHPKVTTSLARHFFWPAMKVDVRRVVDDCEIASTPCDTHAFAL